MDTTSTNSQYSFLQGGGELGELTRHVDWSQTALGTPDQWPQSLRTTLSIILNSRLPMFLFWGPRHLCFYNDAYRPSLINDGKHPYALGKPGAGVWPESWESIKPLIDRVLAGQGATWNEDQRLPIYRNGQLEDVYWTFSYSPVSDELGSLAGVFVTCTDTTEKIRNIEQLQESKDQLTFALEAADLGTWDLNPVTNKFTANTRLKEWFGLLPEDEVELTLATNVIADKDRQRVNDAIQYALTYESGGYYDVSYTIIHPQTQKETIVRAKGRAWFTNKQVAYRFNGTLQDITKEEKAQQLADLAIKSSGIGLFRVDLATEQIEYTPAYAAIISGDSTQKQRTRHDFLKYIHPDDRQVRDEATQAGLKTGEIDYKTRVIWSDGSTHCVSVTGGFVYDEAGKPITFSGTVKDITESENQRHALFKAEEQIVQVRHQSETLFQNVTNSSPAGLWLSDETGGLTYLNKNLVDWTGMAYEDLLGPGWANAIIEADRQRSADTFLKAVATRTHYDVQFRLKKGDGQVVWCRAAGDPYYQQDGSFAGYAGYCLDVEELVSGREALQQSESRFRSLIQQAPVATGLLVGRDLIVDLANEPMLRFWGKGHTVFGKPLVDVLPELEDQPFMKILDEVYTTGKPYQASADRCDLVINGQLLTFYFNFTYQPIFDEQGQVYAILDMAVDVTEQVLARQKLEEAEQALRGAIELAELGTWSIDVATNGLTYSDRMINWFGYDPQQQAYSEVIPILQTEDQERVANSVARALAPESDGIYDETFSIVHPKTGAKRILHVQGKTVFDEAGKAVRMNGTAQDITIQRALQTALENEVQLRTEELEAANEELAAGNEELEASNEEYAAINEELEEANLLLNRSNDNLQKFAYVASHDLQEPLRKIQQFGDLLRARQTALAGEELMFIERMQSAASRMAALIRDLLDFSRISTHHASSASTSISLHDVVDRVLTTLELTIIETKAEVNVGPLPTILGDASQLGQLFQNLVGNALKFRQATIAPMIQINSHAVLATELPPSVKPAKAVKAYYRIDVADNGIGFDEKYLDRIFQVFQRLHGKNEFVGTGIGLAICERVATNHGGAITATSQPAQGATFSVYLPV